MKHEVKINNNNSINNRNSVYGNGNKSVDINNSVSNNKDESELKSRLRDRKIKTMVTNNKPIMVNKKIIQNKEGALLPDTLVYSGDLKRKREI